MLKDDVVRLHHMLDAARESLLFSEKKTRRSLNNDRKLVLALVKSVEIIGEAASKVTIESRDLLSNIPWESIIGMRNRLIHAYYDVNLKNHKKRYPSFNCRT